MEDNKKLLTYLVGAALLLGLINAAGTYSLYNKFSAISAIPVQKEAAIFNQCLDSGKYAENIQNDLADGTAYGIGGTPSFFIGKGDITADPALIREKSQANEFIIKSGNSTLVIGAQPFSEFEKAIEEALNTQGQNNNGGKNFITVSAADGPVKGQANAPVTIIEFSDFQCPFCARAVVGAQAPLPQIEEKYIKTGKVKLVFRNYPLPFHENAQKSAEAAQCANEQGKFWEMHDKMFANQTALSPDNLKKYAAELGLN